MYPLKCTLQQSWIAFLKANCNSLFQTALLISADPCVAEAGVVEAVDELDVLLPATREDIRELHKTVAISIVRSLGSQNPVNTSHARSMLQRGLWPLLQVEQSPRICFVLRRLLGCAMSSCAQIVGLPEADVRALMQVAILQLWQASQNMDRPPDATESAKASHAD